MTETEYHITQADVALMVGENQCHLQTICNLYPQVKLRLSGSVIKVLASPQESQHILTLLQRVEEDCLYYNQLTEQRLIQLIKNREPQQTPSREQGGLLLYGTQGRAIHARGERQQALVSSFDRNALSFAIGPAGSGKTFIAICLAVRALKAKAVRRIILSRPAVEAGEKLGFLPGEMKDKLDPYLQPLYDALGELIPAAKLKDWMDTGTIQIAPLAFMRGRTLSDAVVILDEAQNTTSMQMKMFLTRLGANSKMIVTGDISQVDLPKGVYSGLRDALDKLSHTSGIGIIHFEKQDIVRHPLVELIVEAYDKSDKRKDITEDNTL